MHHVSVNVRELDEAVAFYTEVLGLEVLPRPSLRVDGVWLGLPDGRQVHLIVDADHVAEVGPHFAVAVPDLDAAVAELRARGVEVSRVVDVPTGARQCFLHDPAGNRIELHQPAPAAASA